MIRVSHRASFSYMLRHPWQLALALVGIGIGVAVIVAVDVANASARKAFLLSMDKVTGEATHQIVGGALGVDENVYTKLRVEHGFRAIAPVVSGSVEVNDTRLDVLGIDLFAERDIRPFTSEASVPTGFEGNAQQNLFRSFLTEPGAVTMSAHTAAGLGLRAGESFSLIAAGIERTGRLLGIYDNEQAGLDNVTIADLATAQAWLGMAGRLSRIDVRIDEQTGEGSALARLEAALPEGMRVLTAASRTQATVAMSQAFMTNLTAMSLLALLVGLFLIFNSVSFSVLQRRELIAVVRALGLTRRELFAMILTEAALVGIAASVLGVVFGVFLGEQLLQLVARSINDLYFRLSVTDVSVDTLSIVKGIVAGVGAATVAAAAPALEATTYEPRLAMSRSSLEQRAGRSLPYLTLAGVLTMTTATALLVFSGRNLVAGLAAVFLLIFGFALCVPIAVRWASSVLTPAAEAAGGTPARMAVAGIADGLSRTAVAIVALAIAVSATIGVSVMVDSFRGSVKTWLEQTLQADIYTGVVRGAIEPGLVEDLRNIDGVVDVSTSRRAWIEDDERRTQLLAIDMAPGGYAGTELLDGSPEAVWAAWEKDAVVIVSEPYAYRNQVAPGDTVVLPTSTGDREFRVAARYQSYDINASAVMISRNNYDRYFNDDGIDSLGLYLADGTDVDDVIAAVKSASDGRQQLRVDSNARIRDLSLEIFDQTFVITDVLLLARHRSGAHRHSRRDAGAAARARTRVRTTAGPRHDTGAGGRHDRRADGGYWFVERDCGHTAWPHHGLGTYQGHQPPRVWLADRHGGGARHSRIGPGFRRGGIAACRFIPGVACCAKPARCRDAGGMSMRALCLTLLCLLPAVVLADEPGSASRLTELVNDENDAGFAKALTPRAFSFPEDHGPHPDFRNEWWYITGNLDGRDGRRFGFEITIFRFSLTPTPPQSDSNWRTNQVYISHLAVTDADENRFYVAERFSRGAVGLAGARAEPFRVWIDDWEIASDSADSSWRVRAAGDGIALDLELTPLRQPVLNGDRGLSRKSSNIESASYYYSITRLETNGGLTIAGEAYRVSGLSWLDREWSTSALAGDQVGWDWFALQLSDGTDLMLYNIRNRDGTADSNSSGTLSRDAAAAVELKQDDFEIEVNNTWQSPQGGTYPSGWTVRVPEHGLELNVAPVIADQELFTTVRYWEGAVDVTGTHGGERISGRGYVELTGYADDVER